MLASLVGCSSHPTSQDQSITPAKIRGDSAQLKQEGYTQQAAELADGKVTLADYDEAFENLTSCVTAYGYTIEHKAISPVDGHTIEFEANFGNHSKTKAIKQILACEAKYWNVVSALYQDTAPVDMDEALRVAAIACVRSDGYKLSGSEKTPLQMAGKNPVVNGAQSKQWVAVQNCFTTEQQKLYPGNTVSVVPFR